MAWNAEEAVGAIIKSTPLLQKSKDLSPQIVFMVIAGRLKSIPREGWRRYGVEHPESIADHSWRMGAMTTILEADSQHVNLERVRTMAILHDIAESIVGDITPMDKVSKEEKSRRETSTVRYLCETYLDPEACKNFVSIWEEFEEGVTDESKYAQDLDKLELLLQAFEYETAQDVNLSDFKQVAGRIQTESLKKLARQLVPLETEPFCSDEMKEMQDQYYGSSRA